LDRERVRKFGTGATLKLFEKKAGQGNEELVTITEGWSSESERKLSEVESTFVISIAEQDAVTPEIVSRASRVRVRDVLCSVENWEAPHEVPRLWTIFAREIKPGAVKR